MPCCHRRPLNYNAGDPFRVGGGSKEIRKVLGHGHGRARRLSFRHYRLASNGNLNPNVSNAWVPGMTAATAAGAGAKTGTEAYSSGAAYGPSRGSHCCNGHSAPNMKIVAAAERRGGGGGGEGGSAMTRTATATTSRARAPPLTQKTSNKNAAVSSNGSDGSFCDHGDGSDADVGADADTDLPPRSSPTLLLGRFASCDERPRRTESMGSWSMAYGSGYGDCGWEYSEAGSREGVTDGGVLARSNAAGQAYPDSAARGGRCPSLPAVSVGCEDGARERAVVVAMDDDDLIEQLDGVCQEE